MIQHPGRFSGLPGTNAVTASYRALRDGIRDYNRRFYPLTAASLAAKELNPGAGYVSKLCHEPRVAGAGVDARA